MNRFNVLPEKPKEGEPCNGCGLCCASEICGIGKEIYPDAKAPCPGLIESGDRVLCRFVVAEDMTPGVPPLIRNALGIGLGCCAED